MSVGRHQAHAVRLEDEQRAVQVIPRVLAGDREHGLGDHLLDRLARQRRDQLADDGQLRKVVSRQRREVRLEALGSNRHARPVLLDANVGLGQRLDDLEQLLGRQRQRARLGQALRHAGTAQAYVEIGRNQLDLIPVGPQEHVGEHRHRVLAFHDALKQLQLAKQIVLADHQFHAADTS